MRLLRKVVGFIGLIMILILSSCGPGQAFGSTVTPSPTITNTPQPTPTNTATLEPTASPSPTSTPDFYTQEERSADGQTWFANDFVLDIYDSRGVGICLPPMVNLDKFNTVIFVLPAAEGVLDFGGRNYLRTSPNLWSIASHEAMFGVFSSSTLEISENVLTQTTVMVSITAEETTCTNVWIPANE